METAVPVTYVFTPLTDKTIPTHSTLKKKKKSSDFRSHLNITNGLLCNSTQVEIYIQVEKFRHISLVIT